MYVVSEIDQELVRLFYLIFIKIFNHIVGSCRELILRNALSDWSKPNP